MTPAIVAAQNGDVEALNALAGAGADLNKARDVSASEERESDRTNPPPPM